LLDDRKAVQRGRPFENTDTLRKDLLADTVAGNDCDPIGPLPRFRFSHRLILPSSIAEIAANHAVHLFPSFIAADIGQQNKTRGLGMSHAGDMRCDQDAWMIPKSVIFAWWFVVQHVQYRARHTTVVECLQQIVFIQMRTAPDINEARTARKAVE